MSDNDKAVSPAKILEMETDLGRIRMGIIETRHRIADLQRSISDASVLEFVLKTKILEAERILRST